MISLKLRRTNALPFAFLFEPTVLKYNTRLVPQFTHEILEKPGMATLYPALFPRETEPADPEFEVFQTLKRLPDHYQVYYSKKFKGGNRSKEECEIDFIVFDGSSALLIIEVKGGLIEYDGVQDCWTQNGLPMKTAPERQASANAHSTIEFLGSLVRDVNVGWCVCFPNCSLPKNISIPSGLPKAIIVDEAGMMEIEKAIGLVERYYKNQFKKPGCSQQLAREIQQKLTRGVGFIQKIGVRIAKDHQQILEVTKEQFDVLEDMALNPRMAVKGYAGSGKTLLAQEFARRLEAGGKHVLLLFFNRMVANSVRYGLGRDSTVDVQTFHGFARNRINELDPAWWNGVQQKDEEFWNEDVPFKLADIPIPESAKYDAIIVDEGQDFKRNWFETLELYLNDPGQSNFVVFYDEHQDLFKHWEDLPWGANQVWRKALTKNCRNTKEIVGYLRTIHDGDMQSFEKSPQGTKVVTRVFKDNESERRALLDDVARMIKNEVTPGQIIFILNDPKKDSSISSINSIGKIRLEAIERTFRESSNAIRFTNIRLFKGLEADVVCVLGCPENQEANSELYVQASRARVALYVYKRAGKN